MRFWGIFYVGLFSWKLIFIEEGEGKKCQFLGREEKVTKKWIRKEEECEDGEGRKSKRLESSSFSLW